MWETIQRPYILSQFELEVYGKIPSGNIPVEFKVSSRDKIEIDGISAIREQVKLIFYNTSRTDSQSVDLLIYLPEMAEKPVPVFIGLNFNGNHTITADTGVFVTTSWVRNNEQLGITQNRTNANLRGVSASRWALDMIISNGFGLATMYCGDIDPDYDDGFKNGIHRLYYTREDSAHGPADWGTIAAWAYGLSNALDYLQTLPEVDKDKVIVIGHSRLGKTALWAGAVDERFAITISNNSGCGGAALSRRREGETVKRINDRYSYWFCNNFKKYSDNEDALPVDQHMLIALMASRPVYVASAEEDRWADPEGEFLAAYYAGDAYSLYNKKILPANMPPVDSSLIDGHIGYHIRTGKHDVTRYDWEQYIRFAKGHFNKVKSEK